MKNNLKLIFYFTLFMSLVIFAGAQTRPNAHDSDVVNTIVNGAIETGEVITGHKPLIPFIPDGVLGTAISSIIFAVIRAIEKRKLRKKGLLNDNK